MSVRIFVLSVSALIMTAACTPLGMAVGTGAAAGTAASKEGGISGAFSDAGIKAKINEAWFHYQPPSIRGASF